jgi:hypothetical protein
MWPRRSTATEDYMPSSNHTLTRTTHLQELLVLGPVQEVVDLVPQLRLVLGRVLGDQLVKVQPAVRCTRTHPPYTIDTGNAKIPLMNTLNHNVRLDSRHAVHNLLATLLKKRKQTKAARTNHVLLEYDSKAHSSVSINCPRSLVTAVWKNVYTSPIKCCGQGEPCHYVFPAQDQLQPFAIYLELVIKQHSFLVRRETG